jgi:hypothetical protein
VFIVIEVTTRHRKAMPLTHASFLRLTACVPAGFSLQVLKIIRRFRETPPLNALNT